MAEDGEPNMDDFCVEEDYIENEAQEDQVDDEIRLEHPSASPLSDPRRRDRSYSPPYKSEDLIYPPADTPPSKQDSPEDMDIENEKQDYNDDFRPPLSPQHSRDIDRRPRQDNFNKMHYRYRLSRVLIPAKAAGSVIGKAGSTIKQLREEYGCSVMIPDSASPERIITIRTANYHLGGKVIGRCAEQLDEFLRKNIPIRLMVSEVALRIFPQDLETFCKSEWNADVRIMPFNCPFSTERLIVIGGSPNAKGSSSGYILDTIHESQVDQSSTKHYDPDRWDSKLEYGGFGGNYMHDTVFEERRPRYHIEDEPKISAPQPVRDKFGRDQIWIKKFTLPSKFFIYIVGNAGARLEEIRKGTGTCIIYGPEQDHLRLIQITGTNEQIDSALYLIKTIVKRHID